MAYSNPADAKNFPAPPVNYGGHPPLATAVPVPVPPHNNYKFVQPRPPAAAQHVGGGGGGGGVPGSDWSTGLCGCHSDISNYCITCWCPCITFGQIAEIVDRGSTSCLLAASLYALTRHSTGCVCLYSCFYRSRMRNQYSIPGSMCTDCLIHCCCESCALRQEYRELKHRGFDMSLGWRGNVERQSQGVRMAPFVQGIVNEVGRPTGQVTNLC